MLDPEEKRNSTTISPIRVSRTLLAAVKSKARRHDESVSQVVRRALIAYVTDAPQVEGAHSAAPKPQAKATRRK